MNVDELPPVPTDFEDNNNKPEEDAIVPEPTIDLPAASHTHEGSLSDYTTEKQNEIPLTPIDEEEENIITEDLPPPPKPEEYSDEKKHKHGFLESVKEAFEHKKESGKLNDLIEESEEK